MLRAQYEKRGKPPQDVIRAVEFAQPVLQQGQVLVEVLAAPINPSDVLTLTGEYGLLPPLPAIGGNEGVGRVAELGPGAAGPPVGQRVLLPPQSGTWSTHIVAEGKALLPLPNDADPLQLAMMTVNPPTALLLLREFVELKAGDWVIQNAANSAVGTYLVQLARARGIHTVNIVRRPEAVDGVREAGGDIVLVDGPDLAKRVAEATSGAAIRLGIDAVAGEAIERLAECLAPGGVLVNYGRMSAQPCIIQPSAFIFRDLTLRGFWLALWYRQATPEQRVKLLTEVAQLIASGTLHARVQATYDVSEIREAVAAAAAGERDGKILVVPSH
jgi:NADPH:quinone reductase-like Zn-dependent oxidoreductase